MSKDTVSSPTCVSARKSASVLLEVTFHESRKNQFRKHLTPIGTVFALKFRDAETELKAPYAFYSRKGSALNTGRKRQSTCTKRSLTSAGRCWLHSTIAKCGSSFILTSCRQYWKNTGRR